ncbi:DUF2256 domain-containing protein [Pseudomonas sp. SWI6]|uniref:DUF2256 domain-containing protein n=1 Tax=Pseudomonas taiwanensis TaxID=470150 RepID=A0ABR6V1X1_9PSED|nr:MULTISPECIES: DUF2256 domain-containing protein [Pseudomonas]AGZ35634.1 hypothetical protein PVLB_14250 [Pseudomonas sp. VLB120]AVD82914.1 DUF2256 domain-containing protein [Pseudomonas sp. SWI6]AVD89875.1 DUF2256 domain-containing protein [Pseudomonas sp. SWI44]MBC3474414.1 DUF2256 domain-containing protein [Pseudomonas taiwanensis]MBC3489652.1 DUF2256 domain-containing protein [Pseudomonas taiwanensis]
MKKGLLPSKVCVVCGRPFDWRKRWARCWDQVRYCSQRCRRSAPRGDAHQQGEGQRPDRGQQQRGGQ